jgi:hypothetical protein
MNHFDDQEDTYESDIPINVVVLNGIVKGATNLPSLSDDERDGRAFFRVLHVEGGTKSTMFRCKTMIFNSSYSKTSELPIWSDGKFRFEMLLPQTDNGIHELTGEILIAVYRSRWQGGNDFIGQASFDLGQAVNMNTGIPNEIEHNTIKGSYELIDRQGRVAGDGAEVDVILHFSWRVPSHIHSHPQSQIVTKLIEPETFVPTSPPRSKTSASKTKRPSSAGIRRIQSAQTAKRKSEQIRIDLENKALQMRIQRSGTQAAKNRMESLYKKQEPIVTPPQGTKTTSHKQSSKMSSYIEKSPNELLDILHTIKPKVAAAESLNTTLRAQVTKEKSLYRKMETEIARMRNQELGPTNGQRLEITDPLAVDRNDIADNELKEMIGEHDALQNSRRQLIKRRAQAKKAITELENRVLATTAKLQEGWKLINAADGSNQGGDVYLLSKELEMLEDNIKLMEADIELDQCVGTENSVAYEQQINHALKMKLSQIREDFDKAQYERDICQDRINAFKDEEILQNLNNVVGTLRTALHRCKRKESTEALNKAADAFDIDYAKTISVN